MDCDVFHKKCIVPFFEEKKSQLRRKIMHLGLNENDIEILVNYNYEMNGSDLYRIFFSSGWGKHRSCYPDTRWRNFETTEGLSKFFARYFGVILCSGSDASYNHAMKQFKYVAHDGYKKVCESDEFKKQWMKYDKMTYNNRVAIFMVLNEIYLPFELVNCIIDLL